MLLLRHLQSILFFFIYDALQKKILKHHAFLVKRDFQLDALKYFKENLILNILQIILTNFEIVRFV